MNDSTTLVDALQAPGVYPHPTDGIELIETHISWVLLTGEYAYKLKKPVRYDFVDFTSLEKRKEYCERELELNRRLSPELYDTLVTITGPPSSPKLEGDGTPIEYAVKMKQFPQSNLLSERASDGGISPELVDELATIVSDFHESVDREPPSESYASANFIEGNMEENVSEIESSHLSGEDRATLKEIEEWSHRRFGEIKSLFEKRRENGSVRNCHGDMHLRNIVLYQDSLNVFDCIEFNESFRWIDVIDEVAFLTMDLVERGYCAEANRFLDRYLTRTDQYKGLPLLNFYRVYRAMVRCKVSYLRATQERSETGGLNLPEEFFEYLRTAHSFTKSPDPVLVITHGVSGTGKTTVTQELLESIGAIRLRSDVERKRLAGIPFTRDAGTEPDKDLYSEEMTRRTYECLESKAETVLRAGFPVIVDATFLKQHFRRKFQTLANKLGVGFRILHITCDEEELRNRLTERKKKDETVSDAGETVLDHQLEILDELTAKEEVKCLKVRSDGAGLTEDHIRELKDLTGQGYR